MHAASDAPCQTFDGENMSTSKHRVEKRLETLEWGSLLQCVKVCIGIHAAIIDPHALVRSRGAEIRHDTIWSRLAYGL